MRRPQIFKIDLEYSFILVKEENILRFKNTLIYDYFFADISTFDDVAVLIQQCWKQFAKP